MSNRLYDIINTFNKLVAKDEPKKQLSESAVAKPKSKLEETMAKVEADLKTFKEAKKAKPDFLDVDKDGNKKETFKKAVKDKQVKEAAKPDFLDMDKDGDKKEPMKKAIKDKKVNEAGRELVSGQKLGIQGNLTPFYYNAIAKYLRANGLESVEQFSSEDIDALSSKLGVSMEALADLVGFNEVAEAAENPYQQRILDANKADLAEFLKTGYLDTTSDLYYQMYEYYADQMDPKIRRNTDKQYDFITSKIREIAGVNEAADLVQGQGLGIQGKMTPFYRNAIAKYLKANGLSSVAELGSEDIDVLSSKLGVSMEALADLVGFNNEVTEGATNKELADQIAQLLAKGKKVDSRVAGAMGHIVRAEGTHITLAKLNKPTSKIRYSWMLTPRRAEQLEIVKAGPNHYVVRDTDEAWGDTQKSLGLEMPAESLDEVSAPGQEAWIKKMKPKFVKQYGKKKGMEVLYATAWKRSKNEGAHDAEISEEDPVFEREDDDASYWDFKDLKDKPTSGTRKVAGTRYGGSAQKDDDDEGDDDFSPSKKADAPKRGRGRPKGSGKKLGSRGPTGRSKLMKESRPSLMDRLLDETYAMFGEDNTELTLDQDQLRQHIGDSNFEQLRRAIQVTGTYPESMYDMLYDYFSETGEMPYGAATAEDEDPYNWIHQKLDQMFGDEVGYDQENVDIDMGEPDEDYGTFGDDERPEEDQMNAESVNESKDMIAESLSRILHSYPYEVKTFLAGGDMDKDLYSALFDYYNDQGELPYQVKSGNDTVEWIADKFGTDLRNVELEEDGPKMSDVPAYLRKAKGENFPLSRDQITPAEQYLWVVPGPGSRDFEARAFPNTPQGKIAADEFAYGVKGKVVVSAENPVEEGAVGAVAGGIAGAALTKTPQGAAVGAQIGDTLTDDLEVELKELARLAGLKESIGECGEMSPFTQTGQPEQTSGMSINTNIDTRTGTKTMTVTADGDVADKLAEILSLSGLATQVTARSSEVVGQEVAQEPEMEVVAVGEAKDEDAREKFHASTTPDPKVAGVDAIVDQGDDLNRKKKQHADKPKLGDNPMATENISLSKSLMRELESIKIKK